MMSCKERLWEETLFLSGRGWEGGATTVEVFNS